MAAKAALIYLTALLGLRFAHRRTVSQWTAIDFAAAVAIGTLVGRTAAAGTQSFLVGAAALVTILAVHWVVSMARFSRLFGLAVDHRVRLLVEHGRLRPRELHICGITEDDLRSKLRQLGVRRLGDVRYVLYEAKGELTVVRADEPVPEGNLVAAGLREAGAI